MDEVKTFNSGSMVLTVTRNPDGAERPMGLYLDFHTKQPDGSYQHFTMEPPQFRRIASIYEIDPGAPIGLSEKQAQSLSNSLSRCGIWPEGCTHA